MRDAATAMTASATGRGGEDVASPDGLLPPQQHRMPDRQDPRSNAATAASAAGVRAFTAQATAFYFRAPVKAFFRTRVDYLAYARSIHEAQAQAQLAAAAAWGRGTGVPASRTGQAWQWMRSMVRGSTPGVLASAVRHYGWRVVPEQVLPPLVANVGVGAVLYTSYLQILGRLHEDSGKAAKRVYPPPDPGQTLVAGFLAGTIQSVVAAPLDAIQARYERRPAAINGPGGNGNGNGNGKPQSMWSFGVAKLREIGPRGIFAGWTLSFTKDSLGSAVFFSTFEYVKAQGYYRFVKWYYGSISDDTVHVMSTRRPPVGHPAEQSGLDDGGRGVRVIRPHYAIEPAFLLLAGVGASFAQQIILHPLTHIQMEHWEHLEDLDAKARKIRHQASLSPDPKMARKRWRMFRAYYHAYQETWAQCLAESVTEGRGVRRWLYRGFWWNTIRQVPSTSAALIIFELVRRKYGLESDQIRITSDGYDILLP